MLGCAYAIQLCENKQTGMLMSKKKVRYCLNASIFASIQLVCDKFNVSQHFIKRGA
jgi:hypothetical protein